MMLRKKKKEAWLPFFMSTICSNKDFANDVSKIKIPPKRDLISSTKSEN